MSEPLVGILGGMGPAATVDLMQKILQETVAARDQDHVPMVTWNVPQIPDRQKAITGEGDSPLPAMLKGIAALNAAGAQRIVIPCNTAHYWFDALQAASCAPIIHIVDATVELLRALGDNPGTVGIIATPATVHARLYQSRLEQHGIQCLVNTDDELAQLFTTGCYAVKSGNLRAGGDLLEQAGRHLVERGAQRLLLACTEVPVALDHIRSSLLPVSIDCNRALALACVKYWHQARL